MNSNSKHTELDENTEPPPKRQRVAMTSKATGKRAVIAKKGNKKK